MNKHTPGPWKWAERDNGKDVFLVHPDHGWLTVMDFTRRGMQGGTFRLATWKGDERENMGGIMKPAHEIDVLSHPDARLIAAAPDLLAACIALQAEAAARGCGLRIADEAIAKATGLAAGSDRSESKSDGFVVGYSTCEVMFFGPDGEQPSDFDPSKVVNPFNEGTDQHRGFDEAYYDFTQK